jgi:hypothetical protein
MARTNYPIKGQLAEYFSGDLQDSANEFMTGPALLRAIADFMESRTIRDAPLCSIG